MKFYPYTINSIEEIVPEVFQLQIQPADGAQVFGFQPGQFCQIKDPSSSKPDETHSFSILSSPTNKEHLEFCFKVYGDWTRAVSQKKVGDTLVIAGPLGRFTWNDTQYAVFLAGGVGIVPFISMMRYITEKQIATRINLIYGSRTQDTIAYQDEVEQLIAQLPQSSVTHILSHETAETSWSGKRGFITKDLLEQIINRSDNPDFFLCGPPIFVTKMKELLQKMGIATDHIHFELFSRPTISPK